VARIPLNGKKHGHKTDTTSPNGYLKVWIVDTTYAFSTTAE